MLFSQLIQKLIQDTTEKSLPLFSVELCLCVTIVLMLLVRPHGLLGSAFGVHSCLSNQRIRKS